MKNVVNRALAAKKTKLLLSALLAAVMMSASVSASAQSRKDFRRGRRVCAGQCMDMRFNRCPFCGEVHLLPPMPMLQFDPRFMDRRNDRRFVEQRCDHRRFDDRRFDNRRPDPRFDPRRDHHRGHGKPHRR